MSLHSWNQTPNLLYSFLYTLWKAGYLKSGFYPQLSYLRIVLKQTSAKKITSISTFVFAPALKSLQWDHVSFKTSPLKFLSSCSVLVNVSLTFQQPLHTCIWPFLWMDSSLLFSYEALYRHSLNPWLIFNAPSPFTNNLWP